MDVNELRATEFYERAICKDCTDSMVNLALLYECGSGDVAAVLERSVQLYQRAISKDNMSACFELVLLFLEGKGIQGKD